MTKIDPVHAAEISKAFSDHSTLINSQPRHPTETTKGSLWVDHADGTTSHWQIRRPMTLDEIEREKNPPPPTPVPPIVYPDGIPDGYGNELDRPMQPTWRQLAELFDCILTYRKDESVSRRPFERKHPRMRGEHSFAPGPAGNEVHFIKLIPATPEEEEWHLAHLPTMGLHREDLAAYYRAQRGPLERAIDRLIFWR